MPKKAISPDSLPFKLDLNQVFGTIRVSSVLKDMIYVVLFFLVFILFLVFLKASVWIIIASFVILIPILLFFGYCYYFLMRNDPDSLRSETYKLQKQRLEMMGRKGQEIPAQAIEAELVIGKPEEKNIRKELKKGSGKK
ncbi:hypothetical protein A2697_04420 [Candidatus Curtissbacteria bacterium RIFCSPHIGHO2_01_FULL_41_44]|nr:MAG: hypothetical protein A2697_04420 [Candidatus Curtissbacteria bacterium RIFCSPHIGHO2_01_FULL_41_44]OGE02941.1 MAG: hypothetical protein A3G16_04390 [Candidatus Curtissbacteria bacterium RIFCSPLOWO2_12_FULL_41_16]OGE10714.1 MAG: hypothetical protein A3H87_03380 [Candidatus Curtissbacteria bacterium RIFCSPLOWO2_02_FULL_42_37]